MPQIIDLFPTPASIQKVVPTTIEESYLLNCPDSKDEDREEDYDLILDKPELKNFRQQIKSVAETYAHECLSLAGEFDILQSWINNKPEGTEFHRHKNTIISGVYCIATCENKAFVFDKQDAATTYMMEPIVDFEHQARNKYTQTQLGIPIQKNLLILFPSWVGHGVAYRNPENSQQEIHQTLAFNLNPISYMGYRHSLNQFNYTIRHEITDEIERPSTGFAP